MEQTADRKKTKLICTRALTPQDRKSTRLNSSHSQISYAVFCLKKNSTPNDGAIRTNYHAQFVSQTATHCTHTLSLLAAARCSNLSDGLGPTKHTLPAARRPPCR